GLGEQPKSAVTCTSCVRGSSPSGSHLSAKSPWPPPLMLLDHGRLNVAVCPPGIGGLAISTPREPSRLNAILTLQALVPVLVARTVPSTSPCVSSGSCVQEAPARPVTSCGGGCAVIVNGALR